MTFNRFLHALSILITASSSSGHLCARELRLRCSKYNIAEAMLGRQNPTFECRRFCLDHRERPKLSSLLKSISQKFVPLLQSCISQHRTLSAKSSIKLAPSCSNFVTPIWPAYVPKVSDLSAQIAVQAGFDELGSLIRRQKPVPVQRMGFNLKKLSENPDNLRWSQLQAFDFRTLIFCVLPFSALSSMPNEQFNWLVNHAEHYTH